MRSNPGKTVTIHDIPGLVKAAQEVAMTSRNIVSGFENTGIFSFNRDTFTESDFASADDYDQPLTLEDPDEPDTFDATAEENLSDLAHGDVNEDAEIPLIEIPETTSQQVPSYALPPSPRLHNWEIISHAPLPCFYIHRYVIFFLCPKLHHERIRRKGEKPAPPEY